MIYAVIALFVGLALCAGALWEQAGKIEALRDEVSQKDYAIRLLLQQKLHEINDAKAASKKAYFQGLAKGRKQA